MTIFDLDERFRNIGQRFKKIFLIILIIFAVNAFSLNLGYMSPIFSRFCGFIALLSALLLYYDQVVNARRNRSSILGLALICMAFIMLFLSLRAELWLASLLVFLCGFYLVRRSTKPDAEVLPAISFGGMIYILLYLGVHYNSLLWRSMQLVSLFLSGIIGLLRGTPLSLGPSVEGLFVLISFISCSLSFLAFSKKNGDTLKNFALLNISMILFLLIYIFFQTTPWLSGEKAIDSAYVLFFLLLIPFAVFISKFDLRSIDPESSLSGARNNAILGLLLLSLILLTVFPYSSSGHLGKVIVYEKDCEMNFDLPQFPKANGYLAPERGFSVGALEQYLSAVGHEVLKYNETTPDALKEALDGADVLVLMNLNRPMNSSNIQAIWDFLQKGGGLLIFGEHTSMFASDSDFASGRDYLNEILAPTGIRVNPDTAEFFSGAWKYY